MRPKAAHRPKRPGDNLNINEIRINTWQGEHYMCGVCILAGQKCQIYNLPPGYSDQCVA